MKITPETKIALGLPRGKDTKYDWVWIKRLLQMFAAHPANYLPIDSQAPHANARNQIVASFLSSDAEWILWVDSDTIFEPDDIQKLADLDVDIATGIYFSTAEHRLPVIRGIDRNRGVAIPHIGIPKVLDPYEIDACGLGFCLCKRKVFETLKEPWFEFRSGFSEDLFFCINSKRAGFRIWANPKVLLGHMTQKIVDYRDHVAIPEDMRLAYVQRSMEDTEVWLKKCYPNWKEDLGFSEISEKPKVNLPPNINTKEYWDEVYKREKSVDETWRNYPGKFPFISQELLKNLPEKAKVLELGSGLGVLLKQIKKDHPKFDLTGIDISEVACKSVESLGIKAIQGKIPSDLKNLKKKYDCVIATELLEHLDDEDRLATIKVAKVILKTGGMAIFTVPDRILPPSEEKEHRVCYDLDTFERFLKQVFEVCKVYSKRCLVSDKPHPGGIGFKWAEAPFLFGVCFKENGIVPGRKPTIMYIYGNEEKE